MLQLQLCYSCVLVVSQLWYSCISYSNLFPDFMRDFISWNQGLDFFSKIDGLSHSCINISGIINLNNREKEVFFYLKFLQNLFFGQMWWMEQPLSSQFPNLYKVTSIRSSYVSSILDFSSPLTWNFNFCWNLIDLEIKDLESLIFILPYENLLLSS